VRLGVQSAAEIVEVVNAYRITDEGFRHRHVFDLEVRPEAAGARNLPSPLSAESKAPVRVMMFRWRAMAG
jgi:hypothetical protein